MTVIRSLLFFVLFIVWTALLSVLAVPLLLVSREGAIFIQRLWSLGVLWLARMIAGVRFEVRGLENIPAGQPVLFASKHQSAWDTVIYQILFKAPVYIMKKELLNIPVYGWYCLRTGMIPIDRAGGGAALRNMLKLGKQRIEEGRSIVIFPEGTRVPPGEFTGYQPGISGLYRQLAVPVVPVALNSGLFWPRAGFMKRPGVIVLEFLPAIMPGMGREEFVAELEQRIETASNKLI